ncbi:Shedu anti-phage system protein SduA domain-containing protein [Nostocoides sp. HKS02]|uniref:Shedu anti-phage system protein SduA domain-containing protein n=1 Tax=Nostocoides sp. HKS02 TaxID=1813880 RepID=UPI0012B47B3C|nr:Shedu anti-phage system protein SduA domain-containing protein [Tetrasphaera sp. HKS02]QGN58983.1 DUF4263 domain-containing protein [Tetrasphaera sp. HKS02]
MGRTERWPEATQIRPVLSNPKANPALTAALHEAMAKADLPDSGVQNEIIQAARELIFWEEDDGIHFEVIGFSLDMATGCLMLGRSFEVYGFANDEDAKRTLAIAVAADVPIYPQDESNVQRLVELYESLFTDGIKVPDGEGNEVTLLPRFKAAHSVEATGMANANARFQPADLYMREHSYQERLRQLVEAERVVTNLRHAIRALEVELNRGVRDENALQRILTERPSLLGIEYRQILPKHSLGGEYELDYAAVTNNGFVHCIEIEPSSLSLYSKAGNPRAELVHAEQQVLDWLDWLDRHSEYAASKLPTLLRPTGTVVIGRRPDLSDADVKRLERRNAAWGGTLRVLTYDDLLEQARAILLWLTGGFGHENDLREGTPETRSQV